MLYTYSITHYMQYNDEHANIVCINRDVMFLQVLCYFNIAVS